MSLIHQVAFVNVLAVALLVSCAAEVDSAQDPADARPHRLLHNDRMTVKVYLPDAEAGIYRGPRFDWSGMCLVEVDGHTFFGRLPPEGREAEEGYPVGTAEEFGLDGAVGFDEAAVGERFVKIGVGVLERDNDGPYRFSHGYPLVETGDWDVEQVPHGLRFTQRIDGPRGFGYEYIKTVRIDGRRAGMTIERTLRNTGSRPIQTRHYGHHFFQFGGVAAVDENYTLTFRFEPKPKKLKHGAVWRGRTLAFTRPLERRQTVYDREDGPFEDAAAHWVRVEHQGSGAAATVQGDQTPTRVAVWAQSPVICPEFFVPIALNPGEVMNWSTRYTFETSVNSFDH